MGTFTSKHTHTTQKTPPPPKKPHTFSKQTERKERKEEQCLRV